MNLNILVLLFKGAIRLVSGVITQGAFHTQAYVLTYRVDYSLNGKEWHPYKENGTQRV